MPIYLHNPVCHIILKIKQWSEDNCLVLNDKKTQVLPIYNKNSAFSKMPFFDETSVSFVSEAKNLGVMYSKQFTWDLHFHKLLKATRQTLYPLRIFFKRYTSWKDIHIRKKIATALILPKMRYAISLFFDNTKKCTAIWQSINRCLASVILLQYCKGKEVDKLKLPNLKDSINYFILSKIVHSLINRVENEYTVTLMDEHNRKSNQKFLCKLPPISFVNTCNDYSSKMFNTLLPDERLIFYEAQSKNTVCCTAKKIFLS